MKERVQLSEFRAPRNREGLQALGESFVNLGLTLTRTAMDDDIDNVTRMRRAIYFLTLMNHVSETNIRMVIQDWVQAMDEAGVALKSEPGTEAHAEEVYELLKKQLSGEGLYLPGMEPGAEE